MKQVLTVLDVLQLFPHRKKGWAYKQLRAVRDATSKAVTLTTDFAEHMGLTESELQALWDKTQK